MIIHAAYYDPATGVILQTSSGDEASLADDPRPFVQLEKRAPIGFDMTHRVVDGAVVPIAD
jgi:hypothetical protein